MRKKVQKISSIAVASILLFPMGMTVANAGDSPKPNPIKDCLSKMENPRLAVQFLIDESKSLQTSDPLDQRVNAIKSTIATLTFNFADVAEKDETKLLIDVRLSGFGKNFHERDAGWVPLTENDNGALYSEVEKFRKRDTEGYTNYKVGLEGAERSFVAYDRDPKNGSETACKALVWLSDGNLDLDDSSANKGPENRQKQELCESDGVVDRLRSQQVFVIGLGLNSDTSKKQDFTLMSKILKGGCGEREPYGTFTEVGLAEDLIREMFRNLVPGNINELVPCKGEEQNVDCREVRFSVRPPLSRINILVGLTKEIDSAVVISPTDETVTFAEGGKAIPVENGRVKSQPSFDLSTILKIDVNEVPGEWRLQFRGTGAAKALVMSIFFSDVVVEIEGMPLRIDRREPEPVRIKLGDLGLDGLEDVESPGTVSKFDSPVAVVAELVLGNELVTGQVSEVPGSAGSFVVTFDSKQLENAPSNGVLTLTPIAVLGGQEINFTPRSENVVLVLGDGFPTIKSVSATNIDRDGKSKVVVTFDGPEEGTGSARILVDQFVATEVPAGHKASEVALGSISDQSISIKSGSMQNIEFEVDPTFTANGRFKGEVQIELKNSFGESQKQKVAFDFSMTQPFDTSTFLWVLLLMLGTFLLVQGVILFFAIDRFSRIAKVSSNTYFARFRARLNPNGSIDVIRPTTWFDVFKDSAKPVMSAASGKSRFEFDEFAVSGSRMQGLKCLFAGGDHSLMVSWPGYVVVGSRSSASDSDGLGRITPQLVGQWAVAVAPSDAQMLGQNLRDIDLLPSTYIDHVTGEVREIEKNPPIDVELLYFVPDFDGADAEIQIDEMISRLETGGIRDVIAAVGLAALTAAPDELGTPTDSGDSPTSSGGSPPISWPSSSVDDEYG